MRLANDFQQIFHVIRRIPNAVQVFEPADAPLPEMLTPPMGALGVEA